jgi:hypothetical protein
MTKPTIPRQPFEAKTRSGLNVVAYLLPPDHWSHECVDKFVLRGQIHIPAPNPNQRARSEVHQWTIDGRWSTRTTNLMDLV